MRLKIFSYIWVIAILSLYGVGCAHGPRARNSGHSGLLDSEAGAASVAHARSAESPVQERSTGPAARAVEEKPLDQPVSDRRMARVRKITRHWRWPLKEVSVTSNFGKRGGRYHEGLDLRAHVGTPVFACHPGKVLYSGKRIRGYGNLIVLQHPSGIVTVYAHNSRNLVRTGQVLRQGSRIAFSGNTGRSTGPHLHFEVRDGTAPVNPAWVMFKKDSRLAYNHR